MMLQRQGDWLAQPVGEEMLMMSPAQGNYVSLSPVARRIWEMIETPTTIDAICAQLVA